MANQPQQNTAQLNANHLFALLFTPYPTRFMFTLSVFIAKANNLDIHGMNEALFTSKQN